MSLLIANAKCGPMKRIGVRIIGDRISEVGANLHPVAGEDEIDAAGGELVVGIHDHHVHLRSMAAAVSSISVGPPDIHSVEELGQRITTRIEQDPGSWIRGIGYHESVAGDLTAAVLDQWAPSTPVRIQHRSGAMWILNSEAIRQAGLARRPEPEIERDDRGHPTGRLFRMDPWIAQAMPPAPLDFGSVAQRAAGWGVTGFTDADPERSIQAAGLLSDLPQRLFLMGPLSFELEAGSSMELGAVKYMLDDHDLPDLSEVVQSIREAHTAGRAVAIHCVTTTQLVFALSAFGDAGTQRGDRIEHGSVIPSELIPAIKGLGLWVCTQPNFVAERGDHYLIDVADIDQPDLYRCRSLLDAGIPVAFGTDAPFGSANPWASMAAARDRRTPSGQVITETERISADEAFRSFAAVPDRLDEKRTIEPGQPADLAILSGSIDEMLNSPREAHAIWTIAKGKIIHGC